MAPGDELPPARDLAEELGINFHTVRSAYQQLDSEGLISLGRGRRARVVAVDRSRHRWKASSVPSYSIAVLIPEFVQLYSRVLAGIEAEAALQPALVYVANAHESRITGRAYLDRFLARGVDGVIVAAPLLNPDEDIPESGPPIAFIDFPGAPGISIEFDLERSQYLATRHLIEHGHDRIGFVAPPVNWPNIVPKLAGHVRALEEAGIEYDGRLTAELEDFSADIAEEAATSLLGGSDPPTAITTSSDQLAMGVYRAARKAGYAIPSDLAVTSNDNADFAELIHPALTTVTLPFYEAGRIAARHLAASKQHKAEPHREILDVELVVRASCGCEPS